MHVREAELKEAQPVALKQVKSINGQFIGSYFENKVNIHWFKKIMIIIWGVSVSE